VPSNQYDIWIAQLSKFILKNGTFGGNFKRGWSPPNSQWKIFAVTNVKALRSVTAANIRKANVVICT